MVSNSRRNMENLEFSAIFFYLKKKLKNSRGIWLRRNLRLQEFFKKFSPLILILFFKQSTIHAVKSNYELYMCLKYI